MYISTLMLLGSGELGREFAIAAKRLGCKAIASATLAELEREGWHIVPSAKAVQLTMNRDGIRDFAAKELGLSTSRYVFAETREAAIAAATKVGLPAGG